MPTYHVRVRAIVYRRYEVEAADEKAAIAATVNAEPFHEEDGAIETMYVHRLPPFDTEQEAQEAAFHAKLP